MGGPGSGRPPDELLGWDDIHRLYDELDLSTAEGNQTLLIRAEKLMLEGKLPARMHEALVRAVQARRGLMADMNAEARERRVKGYLDEIKRSRLAGRNLRDVGPPPDSIAKKTKPTA